MKRLALFAAACIVTVPVYAQDIATVNGKPITQQQLDQFVSLLVKQGAQDTPELREQVKQEMIGRQVAVQAAEKAGLSKKPDVRQEIELARQGILVRALMADYLDKHPITDEKVKAEYDKVKKAQEGRVEYKVRHILVKEEDEAKRILADIRDKKTTFEEAAKKDSIDPGSGKSGGDLGWAPTSNYVPEFAQAVEGMKKGELSSAPVHSQFGWHIIEVQDTRPVAFPALDDVKPQIEEMLRQQSLGEYQDNLMKAATIK